MVPQLPQITQVKVYDELEKALHTQSKPGITNLVAVGHLYFLLRSFTGREATVDYQTAATFVINTFLNQGSFDALLQQGINLFWSIDRDRKSGRFVINLAGIRKVQGEFGLRRSRRAKTTNYPLRQFISNFGGRLFIP